MKRRKFLKSIPVVTLPAVIPGMSMHAITSKRMLGMLPFIDTERVLVLIQLAGGCDGLNMVFPRDQYDKLANARSNIIIPASQILALDGTDLTGLHPKMPELQGMYNDGKVSIVQSVAYTNQNYSHFRSTDIWMTGSDSNENLITGWTGRYLDYEYPGAPEGYPNSNMPDPLAIQIGTSVSQVFWGASGQLGYALTNPDNFMDLNNGIQDPAPNTYYGDELSFVREVSKSANAYGQRVRDASLQCPPQYSGYPSNNRLASHLKTVARLIRGGLKTRVYMVTMTGFDNHANQVDGSDHSNGAHPNLLMQFSQAVKAFYEDLKHLSIQNRVIGMTFSEFGRRIKSNASVGTDHGLAAPMILFGEQVQGGIVGTSPVIPQNAGVNDNVAMQFDYRQVYSTMLKDWFCVETAEMQAVFDDSWTTLDLVNPDVAGDCSYAPLPVKAFTLKVSAYDNSYHDLSWHMIHSDPVTSFVAQHSPDGVTFDDIHTEQGSSESAAEYDYVISYLYKYPEGRQHYYRIKAITAQGEVSYTNVVRMVTKGVDLSIYPNPAGDWVNIKLNDRDQSNHYTIELISASGQKVVEQKVHWSDFSASIYRLNISHIWAGQYVVLITDKYNERFQQKLLVAH